MRGRTTMAVVMGVMVLAGAVRLARAEGDAAAVPGVRGDIIYQLTEAETKLVDLAGAESQANFAWRPGKGVRSVAEVYMHVATANYLLPTIVGAAVPEGVALKGPEDMDKFEKSVTQKDAVIQQLKNSFANVKKVVADTPDADLEKSVSFFGTTMSERGLLLLLATHAHEHLGQSIAYARTNKITPPWTAREMAEMAAKKAADETKK